MPTETLTTVVFYLFAALAVGLAVAVVTTQRIFRAAVYLAGVLVASAVFYLLLHMEFLAGIQVLVYVGGIVVLLVYAVMLTTSVDFKEERPSPRRLVLGLMGGVAFFAVTVVSIHYTTFPDRSDAAMPPSNVAAIGRSLFDTGPEGYVLPFELISLLLLAALIGGVVVARKKEPPVETPSAGLSEETPESAP
jgi:NADH-quinone oxidoreductase subunit J